MQIQSVSAWPEKRGEIKKMMELAAKDIKRLGGTVELVDIGKQKVKSPGFHIGEVKQSCLKGPFYTSVGECVTFFSVHGCSSPLERRSPCLQLSWAIWGQILERRQFVYMGIWMSSQQILTMAGIRNLSNWWRKMVRKKTSVVSFWF